MKIGDLIGVDGSRGFNHGCMDYAVLRYLGDGRAEVVERQSCHSCWQVGHDSLHEFLGQRGVVVNVPESEVVPAGENWRADVGWEW